MYKEKKMAPGLTMVKEHTTILYQGQCSRKFLLEASCYLLAEILDHWGYFSNFCFMCKGGVFRSHGYQAKYLLDGSKLESRM